LIKKKVFSLVKTIKFLKILETLKDYLKKLKTTDSRKLAKMLPPEVEESFNHLYLLDLESILKSEDSLKKEFRKTLLEMEKIYIKKQLENLAGEIERLEAEGGKEKTLEKLSRKFRDVGVRLARLEEKE